MSRLTSVPGICEVELVGRDPSGPTRPPELLIEVPHGATEAAHFESLRAELHGVLPADLEAFFFVNTDVGAPECARAIARRLPRSPGGVLLVRCLIPRTFIDCNRVIGQPADHGVREELTAAVPDYVDDPADLALLEARHRAYLELVDRAYAEVCGNGGLALALHTYAPRSVQIGSIDGDIVRKLREAYLPENYARWELRPDLDLISETAESERLAPAGLVEELRQRYAEAGIRCTENASYQLHPATQAYRFSRLYPGRVLCLEFNRGRLADPFLPFGPMRISPARTAEMTAPLVAALQQCRCCPF